MLLEPAAHHPKLSEAVLFRDDGEDRLVETAAEELDLAAAGEDFDEVPTAPAPDLHVFQEGPRKVQGELEARVPVELGEERLIAFVERPFEDMAEIAHRLVAVDGEEEAKGIHGLPPCPVRRKAARI